MAQDPSYAVSPRSLSPQQMYQNSRHGASGLQEWDGSHGQSIQGHQPMAMAEEVPTQYRPQQPYQPYDYQAPYQTEQYAQYAAVAPVTSTPSSSSSGSPQAAEDRAYPPTSLQYPQPHHYAPSNAEYISRENLIPSQEVSSSSYSGQAVGHVGEWRGSGSQSQSVYSNQVTIDPPMSFPLRQVGAPASVASFDSSYTSARRSPPDSQIAFRSPSPPRIAHEPVEARHRSDSLDSRRPSVDAMTASEQDHQSGLPTQKPKRRRADAHQLRVLNEVYARTAFPSTEERIDLGRRLGMSPRQVQIWFQNRRQNAKAGRGPPLGTPAEYQHIPIHPGPPTAYREITKAESEGVDPRYGQPTPTYPGSRMVTKREYE